MTVDNPTMEFEKLNDGSAKMFGMENFGNTCYCNSVLQCLYYSKPFRERILAFPQNAAPKQQEQKQQQSPSASSFRTRRTSVVGLHPHPFAVDPAAALAQSGLTPPELAALQVTLAATAATGTTASTIQNSVSLPTQLSDHPSTNGGAATGSKSVGRRMSLFGKKDSHSNSLTSNGGISGGASGTGSTISFGNSLGSTFDNNSSSGGINSINNNSFINGPGAVPIINGQVLDNSAFKKPPYDGLNGVPLGARFPGQNLPIVGFTEDPFATPETRKRAALIKGPIVNMDLSMAKDYNMEESLFTALKDIFESMAENSSRIGVVSPSKLIEVLKRENELFRSSMHQDAHEFLNFLLNEVIESVDRIAPGTSTPSSNGSFGSYGSGWVHELFEGLLTSETKCLTCENVSRRDEQFLDLSIDLERNTSITACLRQFSASEMLCERNKFHCDHCGGLQEAEKRMKVKKLPKILALHLKRFKFTEDMQRNVKLFHRILYPKHFRLFNTTFDAEDPDKLYELCAVIVHIGGGPYHGHYVSVVKTEHMGWLLFDDEMVESVDQNYVFNFFGDNKGMASAYVLFYQEIDPSQMEKENLYANNPVNPTGSNAGVNNSFSDVGTNVPNTGVNNSTFDIAEGDESVDPHDTTSRAKYNRSATSNVAASTSAIPIPRNHTAPSTIPTSSSTSTAANSKDDLNLKSIGEAIPSPSISSSVGSSGSGFTKFRQGSFGRKYSKKRKDDEDISPLNDNNVGTPATPNKSRGLSFSFKK